MKWLKKIWLKIWSKIKCLFNCLFGKGKIESGKIINGNCWIACFDTMGFRTRVLDFEKEYGCGRLNFFVKNYYKDILAALKKEGEYDPNKLLTAWCSDTFLFFTPDDSTESFKSIAMAAEGFCVRVIWKKWPVRAALGTGQIYVERKNNIVVGSALIDAYECAEKQNWIGLVITPYAGKKLTDIRVDPWHCCDYAKYDVPMKAKDGEDSVKSNSEGLWAAKIGKYGQVEERIKEMQRVSQNRYPEDYESRYQEIYENTLKFIRDTKPH